MKANVKNSKKRPLPTSFLSVQNARNGSNRRRRSKPKRLIVPTPSPPPSSPNSQSSQLEEEEEEEERRSSSIKNAQNPPEDAYEFDAAQFYWNIATRAVQRPLPAIASILALNPNHHQPRRTTGTGTQTTEEEELALTRQLEEMERQEEIDRRTGMDMPLLKDFFDMLRTRVADRGMRVEGDGGGCAVINGAVEKSASGTKRAVRHDDGGDGNDDGDDGNPLEKISSTLTRVHHRRFKELLGTLKKDGHFHKDDDNSNSNSNSNSNKKNDRHKDKEFKRLCELVREERRLYFIAMDQFKQENADQFLLGFKVPGPASAFVDTNSKHVGYFQRRWKNAKSKPASQYGPCCQAVSLQVAKRSIGDQQRRRQQQQQQQQQQQTGSTAVVNKKLQEVNMETFSPRIIAHRDVRAATATMMDVTPLPTTVGPNWLESSLEQRTLLPPHKRRRPQPQHGDNENNDFTTADSSPLLCEDTIARNLALKFKADSVITSKALMSLLLLPGHATARWTMAFSLENLEENISDRVGGNTGDKTNEDGETCGTDKRRRSWEATFIEDPIPHPITARECLSIGINEALYHHVMTATHDDPKEQHSHTQTGRSANVYTLLTLPQSHSKVLVRSTNILLQANQTTNDNEDDAQHSQQTPIQLHAHLEYFAERGMEEYTSYDRAVWLMQKILQPKAIVVACRVDPKRAEIVRMEEKSLAHALLTPSSEDDDIIDKKLGVNSSIVVHGSCGDTPHVVQHFQAMVDVMQGIQTVKQGRHGGRFVICLPGVGGGMVTSYPSTTATVHQALKEEGTADNAATTTIARKDTKTVDIDIDRELCEADAVFLGKSALYECFRSWEWNDSRIAYTFPLQGNNDDL